MDQGGTGVLGNGVDYAVVWGKAYKLVIVWVAILICSILKSRLGPCHVAYYLIIAGLTVCLFV